MTSLKGRPRQKKTILLRGSVALGSLSLEGRGTMQSIQPKKVTSYLTALLLLISGLFISGLAQRTGRPGGGEVKPPVPPGSRAPKPKGEDKTQPTTSTNPTTTLSAQVTSFDKTPLLEVGISLEVNGKWVPISLSTGGQGKYDVSFPSTAIPPRTKNN